VAQSPASILPSFAIWDVKIGQPITQIADSVLGVVACGTNGGPPSLELRHVADYAQCPPEPSGLHEVYMTADDEADYVARAMEQEYKVFEGGTSIYAHPVEQSVLVDDAGIVHGIRIITDDRASDTARRVAVRLAENLQNRFKDWNLQCTDLPAQNGEQPVGNIFIHRLCTGAEPALKQSLRLEAVYLRRKGQTAVNVETQQVNKGYYSSSTRLEIVEAPYVPDTTPPH
jgi:hypothetical protein